MASTDTTNTDLEREPFSGKAAPDRRTTFVTRMMIIGSVSANANAAFHFKIAIETVILYAEVFR
jgi:hypothetical protein